MANEDLRLRIIAATLELAADHPILSLSLGEIATRAGTSLAELRGRYANRIAILEDFAAYIDEQVLAGGEAEAGESARERLLDILMRRFDALVPYRAGLKGIRNAARRDPLFAATLNHIAVGSQKWTLAAARLEPIGPLAPIRRLARAEALVLVTASVLPIFLDDEGEGLPKTMAALDEALKKLDRVAQSVVRMEAMVDRICSKRPPWKRGDADRGSDPETGPTGPGPDDGSRQSGVYTREDSSNAAMAAGAGVDADATLEDAVRPKPRSRKKQPATS